MLYRGDMGFGGAHLRRDARPSVLTIVLLVLLSGAAAGRPTLPPPRRAILDSLETLHGTAGTDAVTRHLPAARAAGDSVFVMRLLDLRGTLYARNGRPRAAGPDLRESLAIAEALPDSHFIGRSLMGLARISERSGNQDQAAAHYRRLLQIGSRCGDALLEERGAIGVAWDHFLRSEFAQAESLYVRSHDLAVVADDTFSILWSRNGEGLCHWNTGRLASAEIIFESVLEGSRRSGHTRIEATALNNWALRSRRSNRPCRGCRAGAA